MKLPVLILVLAVWGTAAAQTPAPEGKPARSGVKNVQAPFAALKPSATFKIGGTADWVLVTNDSVWVAGSKPNSVRRIDPATNKVVATIRLLGEACAGLASGFGSIWVPLCGKKPSLVRIDRQTNKIISLPVGPASPEAGIAASEDSIWIVSDAKGTLNRIDPASNTVRQKISIPAGSYNPLFSDGVVWVTGFESSVLVPVEASTGGVMASIPIGPKPRFLTAGAGSIWTLNQGDGTLSRVDASARKLAATITAGIPGPGGDICYGADSVWATVFDVPLTRVDSRTNEVLRQWTGQGGDSLRFGYDSIWLTDYHRGLLWRFRYDEQLRH
jgi:virginiamycin B lyase